jgi:hypothetical protein
MKEQEAYTKILICTNKALVTDVGRCLDRFKCKWLNKVKKL